MEPWAVERIIDDVSRAKNDLTALAQDDSVTPERLAKCEAAANDLETVVCEIIGTEWVPRDPTELLAAIQCANKNLRSVEADIAAALDFVLLECRADEFYRVWVAMAFAQLLEFERDILCDALVDCMKCP